MQQEQDVFFMTDKNMVIMNTFPLSRQQQQNMRCIHGRLSQTMYPFRTSTQMQCMHGNFNDTTAMTLT